LGFEPTIPLEEGIQDLATWVRDQQAEDRVLQARAELEAKGLVR